MREPAIRLRLDPTNPGHFFACCGVLELAHRAWGGAEAWFEEGESVFCVSPIASDLPEAGASQLLRTLRAARLTNAAMTTHEMQRREELERLIKRKAASPEERKTLEAERASLRQKWDASRDGALHLGAPFDLRLDWHREVLTGGSRFKTWAGQQAITSLAFALKDAINAAAFNLDFAYASHGGVIATNGIRSEASLHLSALRLLCGVDPAATLRLQRYVLGLALTAFTFSPSGYLRQGCNLVLHEKKSREVKTVFGDGRRPDASLEHERALAYAKLAAKDFVVGADVEAPFSSELATKELDPDAAGKKPKEEPPSDGEPSAPKPKEPPKRKGRK